MKELFDAINEHDENLARYYLSTINDKDLKNIKDQNGNSIFDLASLHQMPILAEEYLKRINTATMEKKSDLDLSGIGVTENTYNPNMSFTDKNRSTDTRSIDTHSTEWENKNKQDVKLAQDLSEKVDQNTDIYTFINNAASRFARANNEGLEMRECECPRLARFTEASPRTAFEELTLKWMQKKYPLDRNPTLNLIFVGEGRFLSSAILIGKLNQLGYSVNVNIIDKNYITLSDDYVSFHMDQLEKYKKEHGKYPPLSKDYSTDVTNSVEGYIKHLESYRAGYHQYQNILSELGNKFKVKNTIQGCFSSVDALQGSMVHDAFFLDKLSKKRKKERKEDQSKNLGFKENLGQKETLFSDEDSRIHSYESANGEYITFHKNYLQEKDKRIHGVFLIDIDKSQAYLNQIMNHMPDAFKNDPLVFESTGTMDNDVTISVNSSLLNSQANPPKVTISELEKVDFYMGIDKQMRRKDTPKQKL